MTKQEQKDFLKRLEDNFQNILDEYLKNITYKTIALPGFDEAATPLSEWRAAALWWDYKPLPRYHAKYPFTTELIRHGPTHRASGWLILRPQSQTPKHTHTDWGDKIILHIPMVIPKGDVGFWVDGKIHRWEPGKLFAFDIKKEHYGFNNTDQERSIFVLDFDANEWRETLSEYMTI